MGKFSRGANLYSLQLRASFIGRNAAGLSRLVRRNTLVDHILMLPRIEWKRLTPDRACAALRRPCCNTGPDEDSNPAMILADITCNAQTTVARTAPQRGGERPVEEPPSRDLISSVEKSAPDFTVTFTEDKGGYYISGMKFAWQLDRRQR